MEQDIVDIRLRHLAQGWSVVPVPQGSKHPTIDWKRFQMVRASEAESRAWTEPGLAVVCGEVSGNLVCLDFDELDAYGRWERADQERAFRLPTAISSRGVHVFFRTPYKTRSGKFKVKGDETPAGDLISEGKLVVLPPTLHPDGFVRKWIQPPYETMEGEGPPEPNTGEARQEPRPPRACSVPILTIEEAGVERHLRTIGGPLNYKDTEAAAVGERHSSCVAAALRLRKGGFRGNVLTNMLYAYNVQHCVPPLHPDEISGIAKWASQLEDKDMQIITRIDPQSGRSSMLISDDDVARYDAAFESAEEYVKGEDTEMQWLVEGFLPAGYLVVLGGTSKCGKSCFVTALALAIARGEEFLGLAVGGQRLAEGESPPSEPPTANREPPAVLWCAFEESRAERLMTLKEYGVLPNNFYITHCKPLIDTEDGLALIKHNIIKYGAKFVAIDPLYGASASESLTDGKSARNALSGLKDLCNELGVTIVIIHHLTKNVNAGLVRERMADSNQILATASMDMLLDSKEETVDRRLKTDDGSPSAVCSPQSSRLLKLKCRGRGGFANQTWILRSTSVSHYELVSHGDDAEMPKPETAKEKILRLLEEQGPMDAESLAAELDVSYKTARNYLAGLIADGLVDVIDKIGTRKRYGLIGPPALLFP